MYSFFKLLLKAVLILFSGILLALSGLEIELRLNPALLFRGMGVPVALNPPIMSQVYDVHYSDGDIIYWQANLVRPIPDTEDRLEAHVTFQSDEFGFRNQPPLPEKVDIVVLGRSFTLGA
jgi:hypothetical protein